MENFAKAQAICFNDVWYASSNSSLYRRNQLRSKIFYYGMFILATVIYFVFILSNIEGEWSTNIFLITLLILINDMIPLCHSLFQINDGLIVIAYEDGSSCQTFLLGQTELDKYWRLWLKRLNLFRIMNPSFWKSYSNFAQIFYNSTM